ncbi:hypothetical protein KJK34_07100 [Flavobacterium sp. D11R37]|uniref:hypothetical protein n=1 Tax=Flavobacterium coralii TaxID=2838017 RepID=UPI001CA745BE|nr:hypothetical protein [Flavobacterium coralii]MBY8962516.1 hypothetical protein [Flavobacterium coralii]
MKNLFLALTAIFLFASCSTDDNNAEGPRTKSLLIAQPCFNSISGTFAMDFADGLGNPTLKFGATVQGLPVSTGSGTSNNIYTMYLQLQPLADCEDMYSDSGAMISFSSAAFTGTSVPTINLKPVNIPFMCYKWRVVISRVDAIIRVGGRNNSDTCTSVSEWYDAPLY